MSTSIVRPARALVLALSGLVPCGGNAAAGDPKFEERYETTLERKGQPVPLDWTCDEGDVWRVTGLEFVRGGEFSLVLNESTVVFGRHGKTPVWALVLPDAATSVVGRTAASGSMVKSVWMRFHPSKFGELFPVARVKGPGPAQAQLLARRIALHKMGGSWQVDGFPAIPDKGAMVLDMETVQGPRKFLKVDETKSSIELIDAFDKRVMAPEVPLAPEQSLAAFDQAWAKFDATYAKFGLRPEVDWDALKARYRPLAESAPTTWEAGTAIALMLENLRDLHVWVKAGDELCPLYQRVRPANFSWQGTQAAVGEVRGAKNEVAVGRTKDGIAYIGSFGLMDAEVVSAFDSALEELGDCWALVLDVRMNGGGSESSAQQMAGRFADKKKVYSQARVRDDPKDRASLKPAQPRSLEPRGPWRWAQPVVVLQGRKTMSSAESFVAMLGTCSNVTTMGDATAGASANPELLELPGGIVVNVPRWNDLDAAGKPIEDVGFPPKVPFAATPTSFTSDKDALVTAAIEKLRKQAKGVRRAAKPPKK